jgi:hypothetical protein
VDVRWLAFQHNMLQHKTLVVWLQVWELVPAALQDALGPLIGEKQGEVEANPEVPQLLRFSVALDLSWLAGRQQFEIQRRWYMCGARSPASWQLI